MTDTRKSLMQLIDDRIADGEPVGADMAAVMQVLRSIAEGTDMAAGVQRAIIPVTDSTAEWMFRRPFPAMPSVQATACLASGEPAPAALAGWIMDGEQFAGIRIRTSGAEVHLTAGDVN